MSINILYWKKLESLFRCIFHFFKLVRAFPNILKMMGGGGGRWVSKIGGNLQYKQTMYYWKMHTPHKWVIPNLHFSNIWWNAVKGGEIFQWIYPYTCFKSSFSKKVCQFTTLLSIVLSVRDIPNSQNSSRISYCVSMNDVWFQQVCYK